MAAGRSLSHPLNVLITGASSGVGEALAVSLGAQGEVGRMFLCGRKVDSLERVAAKCSSVDVSFGVGDVGVAKDVEQLVGKARSFFGTDAPDVLVLNAGLNRPGKIGEVGVEEYEIVMDTNVKGVFLFLNAFLPAMKERGSGQVVVTSSVLGMRTRPGMGLYCASKFALAGLLGSVRDELAATSVKAGMVCPGAIDTAWWKEKDRGGKEGGEGDGVMKLSVESVVSAIETIVFQPTSSNIDKIVLEPSPTRKETE